jgi:hypothetical protein
VSFNSGAFNRFTFNGVGVAAIAKTDSESTSAPTEGETVGVGLEAAESIWVNPEGDGAPRAATFNAFTFNGLAFNGGTRQPGSDSTVVAYVPDAESTPAIAEAEQVLSSVILDLSGSDPTFVDIYSVRWGHELNQRAWATFRAIYPGDASSYYTPRPGHRFKLIDFNGVTRFHGTIQRVRDHLHNAQGSKRLFSDCTATGWEQVADRFLTSDSAHNTYTSKTLGYIAADLVTTYLAADGITASGLPAGPTLDQVIFSYLRVSDAFDELSRLTGYWWRITVDRNLEFYEPGTASAAPITIDASATNYRTMEVERDRSQYRNKQFLGNVLTLTASQTEAFVGDDNTRTFTLAYPLHQVPSAADWNGAALTFGIRDVDTGKDIYWSKGSAEITTDALLPPGAAGEVLTVHYIGEYNQVRAVTDSAEITDRTAIEGGTGIYEQWTDDGAGLTTDTAADAYAQSLIDRYAPIPSRVTVESDSAGNILPGQLVSITEPALGLSGSFFVESCAFEVIPATTTIRAQFTASSSQPEAAWQAAWKKRQTQDLTQLPTSGV